MDYLQWEMGFVVEDIRALLDLGLIEAVALPGDEVGFRLTQTGVELLAAINSAVGHDFDDDDSAA